MAQPDIVNLIIEGIQELKGRNITMIDLSKVESAGISRFVICEGTSTMHVASIADSVRDYLLQNAEVKPYNYDGYRNSEWIVIDYGDTLVHVFLPEARMRYNLEELWNDGNITEIADIY